jgi:FKBP-type peptidyl-prolyl cis-trans isomerase FkpA
MEVMVWRARSGLGTFLVPTLLGIWGCAAGFTSPASIHYDPSTGVDIDQMEMLESGLFVQDLSEGYGERLARRGDAVRIHYMGQFPDGRKFDSSIDRSETMDFRLGLGTVIRAWEEGVIGMRVGGRRKLVVPPELGYGADGWDDLVPPDQVLVFEIQLVELN